jgi:hypothetical protein
MTLRPRSYLRGRGARGLPAREIGGRVLAAGAAASPAIRSVRAGYQGKPDGYRSRGPAPVPGCTHLPHARAGPQA